MNKAELIDAIAGESKLTKVQSRKALDAFMSAISEALKSGERVALVGFGSFSVVERGERTGRNPQNGTELKIPAKKVVKFTPGTELKTNVQ